ncbi:hypothetical protein [Bacillus sp. CGMCC 1.16541]|uniref:hypothetical protein n=1 Tax=Bacillus sp. CGMCC 1.16541 TaxID=2185143 RepID=UPI000D739270|nr:hypothetical protein [Bacillus sp. CGMCC 1.16541]
MASNLETTTRQMIGNKIKVHFGRSKKVERVLREDQQGLYIRYDNQRVSVRAENKESNVIVYVVIQQQEQIQECADVAANEVNKSERKVIPEFKFYQKQFRKRVQKIKNQQLNNKHDFSYNYPVTVTQEFEKPP